MKKKKLKIFHGPQNFSGIGGYLANLQREIGLNSDCRLYQEKSMFKNHHQNLELNKKPIILRPFYTIPFFIQCLFKYNTFHFYAGQTFFILGMDLPILKLFRKKILMTYTGSDIRLVNVIEKERNKYFQLLNFDFISRNTNNKIKNPLLQKIKDYFVFAYNHPKFDKRKLRMMKYHNLWVDKFFAIKGNYANASYVIPENKIIKDVYINHLGIGKLEFDANQEITTHETPLVIHAPTNRSIKGTKYIEETVEKLKNDGYKFEFRLIEDIPNDQVKTIYKNDADIFVDQFLVGDYGTFAIEGMFYGKAVICFLRDDLVKDHYPDIPIINANIDNAYEVLAELITNKHKRIDSGKKGVQYVQKNFNVEKIRDQITSIYEDVWKSEVC